MGGVRTKIGTLLLVILFVGFSVRCVDDGNKELVFVERDAGSRAEQRDVEQTPPSTRSSQVELSDYANRRFKICIIPLRNVSSLEDLDFLATMFHQTVLFKLEGMARLVQPIVMGENQYNDVVTAIGESVDREISEPVARKIRETNNADVILFGSINVVDNEVLIEPQVIMVNRGFQKMPMEPMPVSINNFLKFLDPYVDRLLDQIIESQQL
jgi:hypothetical protein